MISKKSKIYVAGHKGLVGSAVVRRLKAQGFKNILTVNKKKLDLKDQKKTFNFLKKIGHVFRNLQIPDKTIQIKLILLVSHCF